MKNVFILFSLLSLSFLNCSAGDVQKNQNVEEKVDIGKVVSGTAARIEIDQTKLAAAIRKDFDANSVNALSLELLEGKYYLKGSCQPKDGEDYTFWIQLYQHGNDLQLKETTFIHTCIPVNCSSCMLTISGSRGICSCESPGLDEGESFCNHSVSTGAALGSGLIDEIRNELDNTK